MIDNKISRADALAILDDLDWHHRKEFLLLAEHVTPETASRTYITSVPKRDQETRRQAEPHIQVKYGRHRVVDGFLKNLRNSGVVESKNKGHDREFRLVEVNGDPRFIPLSCPCCVAPEPYVGQSGPNRYSVECRECGIKIERATKPQAIRAWNYRDIAEEPPIEEPPIEERFSQGGGI